MKASLVNLLIALSGFGHYACYGQQSTERQAHGLNTPYIFKTAKLQNNFQLQYVEQGDMRGAPVILLHGFSDTWYSYEAALQYLPKDVHVFVITQRGHGDSSKPDTGYRLEDFADDIHAFIELLKLKKVVVVGQSMGSTIAQCFALKHPDQIRGLVMVAAFAHYNKPAINELKTLVADLKDPIDSNFVAAFQTSTIKKPIQETRLQTIINETLKMPAYVWKAVTDGWDEGDFTASLNKLKIPTLILWGDKDEYCPFEDQTLLNSKIKESKIIVYEGVGHALHWEEPERFAHDLITFVSSLE